MPTTYLTSADYQLNTKFTSEELEKPSHNIFPTKTLPLNTTSDSEMDLRSSHTPDYQTSDIKSAQSARPRRTITSETILEWWSGHITHVNFKNKSFNAILFDTNRNKCLTEFDFDSALAPDADPTEALYEGAKMVLYITKLHFYASSPVLQHKVDILPPAVWLEQDNNKYEKIKGTIFIEDQE